MFPNKQEATRQIVNIDWLHLLINSKQNSTSAEAAVQRYSIKNYTEKSREIYQKTCNVVLFGVELQG